VSRSRALRYAAAADLLIGLVLVIAGGRADRVVLAFAGLALALGTVGVVLVAGRLPAEPSEVEPDAVDAKWWDGR
jgi:hypothetical protein